MWLWGGRGLLWWPSGKELAFNAGDMGSIPGLGRSLGEGDGNWLQYSCLENPMNRGAWPAAVCGVTRVRYGLAIKQQHLWVARTQTPKVSVSVITAGLFGWCICEQSRGIPELLFCWQVSGCACVSHRPMCSLGFRVAPVLETGGLCAIAPFAGEQPRGGSHPVAHVSPPSTVVTKWEEALVSLLLLWWGSDGWLWFIICTLLLLPSMLLFLRVLEFFQQITSYWEPLEGSRIDGIQYMERPQWGH